MANLLIIWHSESIVKCYSLPEQLFIDPLDYCGEAYLLKKQRGKNQRPEYSVVSQNVIPSGHLMSVYSNLMRVKEHVTHLAPLASESINPCEYSRVIVCGVEDADSKGAVER